MRTKILIAFFAIVLCSCTTMNFNEGSSRLFVAKSADTNGSLNNGHLFFHSDDNLAAQNIIHKANQIVLIGICNNAQL